MGCSNSAAVPERNKVLVVVAPSGVGKDTVMQKVLDKYPDKFKKGVTHTSRKMRPGEKEGFNYYYVTEDQFIKLKDQNGLVELHFYNGNYYGLSKKEFDTNGAKTVHDLGIPTYFLAILPPSEETLEKRIKEEKQNLKKLVKEG